MLLFALDANTGASPAGSTGPQHSIRNNAIAIADGRVYLIDRPLALADRINDPKPNGKHRPLLARRASRRDAAAPWMPAAATSCGRTIDDIFGTQLAVSSEARRAADVLPGVKHNFFKLPSEIGGRMAAFSTDTGTRLWDQRGSLQDPADHQRRVHLRRRRSLEAEDGRAGPVEVRAILRLRPDRRPAAHLMLFRSATLGYLDLSRDAGTENFGGMRRAAGSTPFPPAAWSWCPTARPSAPAATRCRPGWPCRHIPKTERSSAHADPLLQLADRVGDCPRLLGQIQRRIVGDPAIDPFLGRDDRAVAAAAEVLADLARGPPACTYGRATWPASAAG